MNPSRITSAPGVGELFKRVETVLLILEHFSSSCSNLLAKFFSIFGKSFCSSSNDMWERFDSGALQDAVRFKLVADRSPNLFNS